MIKFDIAQCNSAFLSHFSSLYCKFLHAVNYNLYASGAQKYKSSNFNESGWQAALKTSYGRYRDVINLPKTNYPVSGNNLLSSLSRLCLLYQDLWTICSSVTGLIITWMPRIVTHHWYTSRVIVNQILSIKIDSMRYRVIEYVIEQTINGASQRLQMGMKVQRETSIWARSIAWHSPFFKRKPHSRRNETIFYL